MSWEKEVEELKRREALARKMGGEERIQRQHDNGRLTVRERIDQLVDEDSLFMKLAPLPGKRNTTRTAFLKGLPLRISC